MTWVTHEKVHPVPVTGCPACDTPAPAQEWCSDPRCKDYPKHICTIVTTTPTPPEPEGERDDAMEAAEIVGDLVDRIAAALARARRKG